MPASMIRAPTGGNPNVIGNSIATVAMVPMPGSTPTSVPTSAPIRQSMRLIGVKATPKPRARLVNRSAITPSLNHEAREELQRQPERIGEKQAAADGQADADDHRLLPSRLRRSHSRNHEGHECRDDEAHRTDRHREAKNRKYDEERSPPVILCDLRPIEYQAHDRNAYAEQQQQDPEHARCGTCAKGEPAHPLQVARRPQGECRDCHQDKAADKVLRATDPFRHDGIDRPMARRISHRSLSPRLLARTDWLALRRPGDLLAIFVR